MVLIALMITMIMMLAMLVPVRVAVPVRGRFYAIMPKRYIRPGHVTPCKSMIYVKIPPILAGYAYPSFYGPAMPVESRITIKHTFQIPRKQKPAESLYAGFTALSRKRIFLDFSHINQLNQRRLQYGQVAV